MSLKEKFNINILFVNEEDIIPLYSERFGDTYRFKQPIQIPSMPGFYLIPEFLDYGIDIDGNIYSFLVNKFLTYVIDKDENSTRTRGYYKIGLKKGNVFEKTSRHRLKMLTFSTYDDHPKELQVNHKDGIPGNDDFDNLEWCDNSHNIRHAIEMGLISKQLISVDVKNVLTGETFSAKSISEASSKSGVSIPALHSRLRNPSYLASDGWVIKYSGYDWTTLTRTPRSRITNTAVIAWCLKTNTKQKFATVIDASEVTGVNKAGIRAQCVEKTMSPNSGYVFRYERDEDQFPVYDELQIQWFKFNNYPPTLQTDGYAAFKNGQLVAVGSKEVIMQLIGFELTPKTFRNMLSRGETKLNGYDIQIVSSRGS